MAMAVVNADIDAGSDAADMDPDADVGVRRRREGDWSGDCGRKA